MEYEAIEFELPLEAHFQLRATEVAIQAMTRDELEKNYLRLIWQQMMERKAIATVLQDNNIEICFDAPSEETMQELEEVCDGDEPFSFL